MMGSVSIKWVALLVATLAWDLRVLVIFINIFLPLSLSPAPTVCFLFLNGVTCAWNFVVIEHILLTLIFVFVFCSSDSREYIMISFAEAGAGEEKDNLWRTAQEEVWNARRLWMGRWIMEIAQRRLFLLVAWRLEHLHLSLMPNAILQLFLGGSQNPILALVIIFEFFLSFFSSIDSFWPVWGSKLKVLLTPFFIVYYRYR